MTACLYGGCSVQGLCWLGGPDAQGDAIPRQVTGAGYPGGLRRGSDHHRGCCSACPQVPGRPALSAAAVAHGGACLSRASLIMVPAATVATKKVKADARNTGPTSNTQLITAAII